MEMNMLSATKIWTLIILSFLGGISLMFLRLPIWACVPWVVLVLLYWVLMLPHYVNVGTACVVGFFLDILYNAPVGENALVLILIVYFTVKFRGKFESLGFRKAMVAWGLMIFYQAIQFILQPYSGYVFSVGYILSCAVISALIWPILAWLIFNYQLKYRI